MAKPTQDVSHYHDANFPLKNAEDTVLNDQMGEVVNMVIETVIEEGMKTVTAAMMEVIEIAGR